VGFFRDRELERDEEERRCLGLDDRRVVDFGFPVSALPLVLAAGSESLADGRSKIASAAVSCSCCSDESEEESDFRERGRRPDLDDRRVVDAGFALSVSVPSLALVAGSAALVCGRFVAVSGAVSCLSCSAGSVEEAGLRERVRRPERELRDLLVLVVYSPCS